MDGIIQWVKNLIFIILFTSFIEMFLPDNNMQKYVRVVMGFFIITILISPLLMVFKGDFTFVQDMIPERILDNSWEELQERGAELENANQNLMMDYYEKKIAERVKEVVSLNYDDYQSEIDVLLDENYRIMNLKVILIDQRINEVQIEKVRIDTGDNSYTNSPDSNFNRIDGKMDEKNDNSDSDTVSSTNKETKDYTESTKRNLKYNLSQVFQIPIEAIEVIIKKEGQ